MHHGLLSVSSIKFAPGQKHPQIKSNKFQIELATVNHKRGICSSGSPWNWHLHFISLFGSTGRLTYGFNLTYRYRTIQPTRGRLTSISAVNFLRSFRRVPFFRAVLPLSLSEQKPQGDSTKTPCNEAAPPPSFSLPLNLPWSPFLFIN